MWAMPETWVAVAFVIFVAVALKAGALKGMMGGLDARGDRVRQELAEAKRLREEAQQVLADYKRRRNEAEREAETIVTAAREDAERIAREAEAKLNEFVQRRTAAAEQKIAQAEIQASAEVRAAAAEAAIQVSETILRERLAGAAGQDVLTRSLSEVRAKLQ